MKNTLAAFLIVLCAYMPASTASAAAFSCTSTTQAASLITATGATANGTVASVGSPVGDTRGFVYGTVSTLVGGDTATTTESITLTVTPYTGTLSGLLPSTTYYVRAYCARSGSAFGYGSIVSFTTAASVCGFGSDIGGGVCRGYLTSGTSWSVPADWNSSNNTIEAIGGGGGGSGGGNGGGGGGEYRKIANFSATGGGTVSYTIGGGGAGGTGNGTNGADTTFNTTSLVAKGGGRGLSSGAGGTGGTGGTGAAANFNGGNGGNWASDLCGGGGGGSAGPNGVGKDGGRCTAGGGGGGGGNGGGTAGLDDSTSGGNSIGGNGGDNSGGTGHGTGGTEGGTDPTAGTAGGGGGGGGDNHGAAGGAGTEWDATHGSGGGSGGDGFNASGTAASAGLYGGGGGSGMGTGGSGAAGIIVITYTRAVSRSALSKPPNNLGLIGYWPFNEATSTQTGDFSGNGRTGTITGALWTNGKSGSALSFAGGTNNVDIGTFTSINSLQKTTISFWMYDPSPAASESIFSRDGASASFILGISDPGMSGADDLYFTPDGHESVFTTSGGHRANRWELWTVVYDGSQGTQVNRVQFYLNGVAQSTDLTSTPIATTIDASGNNVHIGNESNNSGGFTGIIDDVRVYNRALSATEVAALYAGGTTGAVRGNASSKTLQNGTTLGNGLVGLWSFDGGNISWTSASAGVAYDGSGNNNIGTLTGMTRAGSVAIGKLGQALSFDGSTSYVDLGNPAQLQLTSDITVSAWIKPNSCGGSNYLPIVGKRDSTAGYELYLPNDNSCDLSWYNGTELKSTSPVSLNQWSHVVGTVQSGALSLYINGVSVHTDTGATPTSASGNVYIGQGYSGDPSTYRFSGAIDDVRIYNRALSASEISQLYTLGKAVIHQ